MIIDDTLFLEVNRENKKLLRIRRILKIIIIKYQCNNYYLNKVYYFFLQLLAFLSLI